MPILTFKTYIAQCDICMDSILDDEGLVQTSTISKKDMKRMLIDNDWVVNGNEVYCHSCVIAYPVKYPKFNDNGNEINNLI